MTTRYIIAKDINGYTNPSTFPNSDTIYTFLLAASTVKTFTVPSDLPYYVLDFSFSPGAIVYVSVNGTAALPVGDPALDVSVLNPNLIQVKKGAIISMIAAADTTYGSVAIYGQLNP